MPIRDDYLAELELLSGLKSLTSAYEEISVMRISRVRKKVLATRSFREGLFEVFSEVRASRHNEIEQLLLKRRSRMGPALTEDRVAVLLSANQRLSGTITSSVIRRFEEYVDANKVEVAIVGRVGRDDFSIHRPDKKFTYFELPDDDAPLTAHTDLVAWLRQYRNVSIHYGKFVNVVDQVAATTNLAQDKSLVSTIRTRRAASGKKARSDYLFEPELQQVLDFFDTQLFAMLYRQTVSESSLAHLGSRITAMEVASATIEKRYVKLVSEQRRAKRQQRNKKQRELMSGLSLWGI